ncbi:MAG: NAD-dependent epimerase/dehydratase family protein [Desulfovibrionaceae bacterium]|nr:NAD-dependent epimerase/dehydratase family protein [Desulfovibrionaceae bacterium]
MHVLVTGAAGFIGFFLCRALLEQGHKVCGLDNLDAYYDPRLKQDRLALLQPYPHFRFQEQDLRDGPALRQLFASSSFTHVVNLAAQAGVRYSLVNPAAYLQSNLMGFGELLEACRKYPVEHLVYASSSSVYGASHYIPLSLSARTDSPLNLYAASKKANELMAQAYSHLYRIPATGLRFFTVYGPWGRPDMAYFSFAQKILADEPVQLFNHGRLQRDFTYIDDIIQGLVACLWRPLQANSPNEVPHKIYNLGNNKAVDLEYFVTVLENCLGRKAQIEYLPMQRGDVYVTCADIADSVRDLHFSPSTDIEVGLMHFVCWYKDYYRIS